MPLTPELLEQYNAVREHRYCFDLSDRTKVQITGADRAAFLHNFCTNDIKNLPSGRGCEAFLCNGKGKTLAYFRVFALPDALWLDAAPGLGSKIVQHLERYVITEDVTIKDQTAEFTEPLIAGPTAAEGMGVINNPRFLDGPFKDMETRIDPLRHKCPIWRADVLGLPCYCMLSPIVGETWVKALAGGELAARECYEILRVEAGMPEYGQDIDESNYPQEVGRDAQTISFTKGCYLGQEPIVMIRDRGQVSRLLVGLKLPGDKPVTPGTQLTHDGKEVGKITSSVWSPVVGGPIALGYVRRGLTAPGTQVQVAGSAGQAVVTKLPFAAA